MIYRFKDCVLDTGRYVLHRAGDPCPMEPQVFDVLVHLVRNRGRVVTKEELLDDVWGTRFVSEASVTSRIRAARRAVGDDGSRQAVIRTARGRGYEFLPVVTEHADSSSGSAEPDAPEPTSSARPAASSLPAAVFQLIGRESLIAELRQEVLRSRLVTLIGPGGIGKTSVAYAVARSLEPDYPDGVHPVEFVTVDAAGTLAALATSLGVQQRRHISLEDSVMNVLRPRRALLLLDNCEHLVEPLGTLLDRLLRSAPRMTVVATSRQPIAVPGERIWPVEPLAVGHEETVADSASPLDAPAVRLFAERARAADPRFVLDEAVARQVARVCRRLDGMPLAIELAAARVATLSIDDIERHLDERFRLLRTARRGGDPRHKTLQGAVQWSYDLLDGDAQKLFAELAIFAGQFDLAAAAAVCGGRDELDTLDLVTGLVERSMIVVRPPVGGHTRYELLETLRDFGRSKLDDADAPRLAARHAAYHAQLAVDIADAQRGAAEPAANARAEAAFADLRTALRFAVQRDDAGTALTLVNALREYGMRSMRYEALAWADAALGCTDAPGHDLSLSVKGIRAYSAWLRGEFETALALANEIEDEESARGEPPCGLAQRVQANVLYVQGDIAAGLAAGRRQLALAEDAQEPSRIVHAGYMMSVALSSTNELEEASELAERTRSIAEMTGSPTDRASALAAIGFATHDDVPAALRAFEECDRIARLAGNHWMSAFARTELSALLLIDGDAGRALRGLAEAVDTWHRAGEWSQQWLTLARCVVALMAVGADELAAQVIGSIERRATMGTPPVNAPLRERTLFAADELAGRLGDAGYAECHQVGALSPVAEVVHATRTELLRHANA